MKTIDLLKELTLASAVSGNEQAVSVILDKLMSGFDVREKIILVP